MSKASHRRFKRLAQIDLAVCHVDDEFDEVNFPSLTENYSRIQRRKPYEAEHSYA